MPRCLKIYKWVPKGDAKDQRGTKDSKFLQNSLFNRFLAKQLFLKPSFIWKTL